jgi:RHS repeat-associated protein
VRGYVYNEFGQVISMLIAGNPLRYEEIIWLDHTPIGRVESSTSAVTAVHVIHSDHLNTPRALANAQTQGGQAAGTVVWRWKLNQQTATGSNAFGAQPADEDPDGNGTSVRFDLRFPGQQYDAATGVHYNYFRDYEPGTGRYVESDPIGLRGGVATYSYGISSPLKHVDYLGLTVYMCKRPMRGRGVSWISHAYVCATNPETGNIECGGHAPSDLGGALWSDGTDSNETFSAAECKPTEQGPGNCEEKCVIWYINQPRPTYSAVLPGVRNCWDWVEDVIRVCKTRCKDDPNSGDNLWAE